MKVYGRSDDLIEFFKDNGGCFGEVSAYNVEEGVMVTFDDGTIAVFKCGKADMAIWQAIILKKGQLFDRVEICDDEEAEIYSDVLYLKEGVKKAWSSREWESVS